MLSFFFLFHQSWVDNLLRVSPWVAVCFGALCIILQLCNSKSGDSAHHPPPEKVAGCMQFSVISKLVTALWSQGYTHLFSLLKIPLKLCCSGFKLWFCVKLSYQLFQLLSLQNTLIHFLHVTFPVALWGREESGLVSFWEGEIQRKTMTWELEMLGLGPCCNSGTVAWDRNTTSLKLISLSTYRGLKFDFIGVPVVAQWVKNPT